MIIKTPANNKRNTFPGNFKIFKTPKLLYIKLLIINTLKDTIIVAITNDFKIKYSHFDVIHPSNGIPFIPQNIQHGIPCFIVVYYRIQYPANIDYRY